MDTTESDLSGGPQNFRQRPNRDAPHYQNYDHGGPRQYERYLPPDEIRNEPARHQRRDRGWNDHSRESRESQSRLMKETQIMRGIVTQEIKYQGMIPINITEISQEIINQKKATKSLRTISQKMFF
jgi:hypothetical protein